MAQLARIVAGHGVVPTADRSSPSGAFVAANAAGSSATSYKRNCLRHKRY